LEIGLTNGWELLVVDSEALRAPRDTGLLFVSAPHCIYQAGTGFLVVSSENARQAGVPYVRFCVHSALLYWVPLFRDFFRWVSACSADAATLRANLKAGQSCMLVPGGSEEVMWAGRPDREHLVLQRRKGFIKLALREGIPLVPMFTYGESMGTGTRDLPFFSLRLRVARLIGLPLRYVSLCQRWWFPFPHGKLVVAIGRVLQLSKEPVPEPSQCEIDAAHEAFLAALRALVDETKERAGYPNIELAII